MESRDNQLLLCSVSRFRSLLPHTLPLACTVSFDNISKEKCKLARYRKLAINQADMLL